MAAIIDERRVLIDVLLSGDLRAMKREIEEHILTYTRALDYDRSSHERRAELAQAVAVKRSLSRRNT
jgi:hypothetical protein